MLTITQAFKTEDGKTFDTRNQALIYAVLQESGIYLAEYTKMDIVNELDRILIVYEREEEEKALEAVTDICKENVIVRKDEKSDMVGLKNYIQNKLDHADENLPVDVGVRAGYKGALQAVLDSMTENGY